MWLRTNYRAPYFLYDGNIGKMALYFPTDVSILSLSAKLCRIVFLLKPICSFVFSQIFLMIDEVISLTCDQAAIFVSLGEILRREERNEILASNRRKRI